MARSPRRTVERKLQPDETVTVSLRMPGSLRARLEQAAEEADRNLSQETARRLRLSFEAEASVRKPTQSAGSQAA